jgi:hypothetical protein
MLADVVSELASGQHSIRVVTSRSGYQGGKISGLPEAPRNVRITYLWTPPERYRSFAWVAFLVQALMVVPFLQWDRCVLLTDPPFLVLAAICGRLGRRSREVFLWTMDLYPEALVAHGLLGVSSRMHHFFRWLNNLALTSVTGIVCLDREQARRMRSYPALRQRADEIAIIPPWDYRRVPPVDRPANRFLERYGLRNYKIALYAGNLGQAHSYKEILAAARALTDAQRDEWKIVFVIRGAGKAALEEESAAVRNVLVLDYQPPEWTADLLWAADVHLITMRSGWEGIVVPSKLYGVAPTGRPVLFIGPANCGTAQHILEAGCGEAAPPETSGSEVAAALLRLAASEPGPPRPCHRTEATELAGLLVDSAPLRR